MAEDSDKDIHDKGADAGAGPGEREKKARKRPGLAAREVNIDDVRSRTASIVWGICVVFALFLAVGALCVALEANADNPLVSFILSGADRVDLGIFSQEGGIKEFTGSNAEIKNALFNWGLGAIFWLVVGRLLDRIIRP
ncbi:hypothetical protein [Nocardioides sp.]|uniref:hypothetical protein n=1 Tax=Nocardioides sp. TaxID=35761 RepID=UPI002733856E|nr:hypothetical protein [Nocardioides sp.]MDP3890918.1 hypothetical protein [Nocardioides sp.]